MTHAEIRESYNKLEKARRLFLRAAMRSFDAEQAIEKKALMDACERLGHNFVFSHIGPLNNSWFYCSHCRKSKVEL